MGDVEDRLEALEQTDSWIKQKLRPGIQSLKEAMQTQITELRQQLDEERAARQSLQKQLDSLPDLAAIKAFIQTQLKNLPAAASPSSSSSPSPAAAPAAAAVEKPRVVDPEPEPEPVRTASTTTRPTSSYGGRPTSFVPVASTQPSTSSGRFQPTKTAASTTAAAPAKPAVDPALAELQARLDENDLGRYARDLAAGGVTSLAKLAALQPSDLSRFGVSAPGHRKLFTVLLEEVQAELGLSKPAPPSEVEEKLKSVGLERYAAAFAAQGIRSLKQLADLDPSRYASVGVSLPAHKKKLATLVMTLETEEEEAEEADDLFPGPSRTSSVPSSAPAARSSGASLYQEPSPRLSQVDSAPRARPTSSYGGAAGRGGDSGAILEAVRSVRDDGSDTDWMIAECTRDGSLAFEASGSYGFDEFQENISDSKIQYGLLRLIQGDQESRRVKFVFVRWVGPSCPTILKAKANTLKNDVMKLVGQFHVEIFAEDPAELTIDIIKAKLKAAAGADYDQGNKEGYTSSASSIRARALDAYQTRERQGTLGKIVYESHALPSTTPCDISNRPFVAPKSEALSNIRDLKTSSTSYY